MGKVKLLLACGPQTPEGGFPRCAKSPFGGFRGLRKNGVLIVALLLSFSGFAQSPKEIDWKLLAKVEFEDRYHEEYEAWYLYPKFSEEIQKLDGKKVTIKGYVIPLDVEGGVYALSAYPFSACFFCGGAGPESVMSLKFDEPPDHFKTDDVASFTGTLELNVENVDDFNYILWEAREVED